MVSLEHAYNFLRQKICNSFPSKRKLSVDLVQLQSSKQPRLTEDLGSLMSSSNTHILDSNEANAMDLYTSDDGGGFIMTQERAQDMFDSADESYRSSFFTDALENLSPIRFEEDFEETDERSAQYPHEVQDENVEPSAIPEHFEIDSTSSESSDNAGASEYPDLFSSTFGKFAHKNDEDEDEDDDKPRDTEIEMFDESPKVFSPKAPPSQPPTIPQETSPTSQFLQTLRAQGYDFVPCEHTPGCTCDPITRLSTPPLLPSRFVPITFPTLPTALPSDLLSQQAWHVRAKTNIPKLSSRDTFDASRRYWIAVLLPGKRPDKATSAREYVWMKGNKFSTVRTVWHFFQTTTMADPEDLVLLLGHSRPGMGEQMQELDYFNDKLVLFRAVGRKHPEAKGRSLTSGLDREIIELD